MLFPFYLTLAAGDVKLHLQVGFSVAVYSFLLVSLGTVCEVSIFRSYENWSKKHLKVPGSLIQFHSCYTNTGGL